jgi:hypothetical protein
MLHTGLQVNTLWLSVSSLWSGMFTFVEILFLLNTNGPSGLFNKQIDHWEYTVLFLLRPVCICFTCTVAPVHLLVYFQYASSVISI